MRLYRAEASMEVQYGNPATGRGSSRCREPFVTPNRWGLLGVSETPHVF